MSVVENVEYGLRVAPGRHARERRRGRRRALDMVRLAGLGGAQAGPALRRPAPARRARPRDRQRAGGAAARRAARRARPQAAPGDAARAQADPARGRHHVRLRHARPGGGADDERPHRRVQPAAASSSSARRSRSTSARPASSSPASSASPTCSSAAGAVSRSARRRSACWPTARERADGQPRRARPHRGRRLPRHGHPLRGRARRTAARSPRCARTWRPRPPRRSRPGAATVQRRLAGRPDLRDRVAGARRRTSRPCDSEAGMD